LDLAIITDRPLTPDVRSALAEDFSESDLPWKVDVVDWATTSEAFPSRDRARQGRVIDQDAGRFHGSLEMRIQSKPSYTNFR
jgi:hypothetical protein